MQIPKISHVPIQQPIYVNGVMHQVWINFFERLSELKNESNLIDLVELAQRVAEEPSQAIQGQQGFAISTLQNRFELNHIVMQHQDLTFDSVSIPIQQIEILPPIQAVFLCHEQGFERAEVPKNEVIQP